MFKHLYMVVIAFFLFCITVTVAAQDIDGVVEHPMFKRYPGQVIAWQSWCLWL